ncbi:MAG: GC-type dockerin domain-anchored protein [Planctomycetota bacterium]|jgi:hypothetical protein
MTRKPARLLAAAIAVLGLVAASHAQETSVQNDSLVDGGSAFICPCFVEGEEAAAWLTAPCSGSIVAVQVFWKSNTAGQPQVLQDSIRIYAPGNFPTPGPIMQSGGLDAEFLGPVLTDGGLNEFRFLDENQTVALDVPVEAGQQFVVSLKFAVTNAADVFAPSVASDFDGCQGGKNAVFAIPGGWSNACALGVSGDWIIRAIVDCNQIGKGGCCLSDETCNVTDAASCAAAGGIFLGGGSTCETVCPEPEGGCCTPDGLCTEGQTEIACVAGGGIWQGPGSDCGELCVTTGACCFADPEGCANLSDVNCATFGGTFQGLGTECSQIDCTPEGACCFVDGACADGLDEATCQTFGGAFQGAGTACGSVSCPQPIGACCADGGVCADLPESTCTSIPRAVWAGPGTSCAAGDCNAPCPADVTGDGVVDVQDLVEVVLAWGSDDADADVNDDGVVDVQDLVEIITTWGPCG